MFTPHRLLAAMLLASASHASGDEIDRLVAEGRTREAEAALRAQIDDPAAPVTTEPAARLEILRRTRMDFSLSAAEVLKAVRAWIPDATPADVERWRASGDLESRLIDGEPRFFRRAVGNLFLINQDARERRTVQPAPAGGKSGGFSLTPHLEQLASRLDEAGADTAFEHRHRVWYTLRVSDDCPRLRPGAVVEAWLPFPQGYGRQRDVCLLSAEPSHPRLAPNGSPQRTAYFKTTVGDDAAAPSFAIEFEFVTAGFRPRLRPDLVEPYDEDSTLYREFTADRPPHLAQTDEVRALAAEIVGDETNPLEKARLVFRWVSKNVPWVGEKEYGTIPSLCGEGLGARRGDCGVQGATFITLCRAAGVPARWQSGWQLRPRAPGMHDWSEVYIEPWGWLPVDASYGVRDHDNPVVRDFLCGGIDPYRMIVNLDFGRELDPPKTSFRSEPLDFQRGEVEIDDHNLYYDEWTYELRVESTPLDGGEPIVGSTRGGM